MFELIKSVRRPSVPGIGSKNGLIYLAYHYELNYEECECRWASIPGICYKATAFTWSGSAQFQFRMSPFTRQSCANDFEFNSKPPTPVSRHSPWIRATLRRRHRHLACSITCMARPCLHWYLRRERAAILPGREPQHDPPHAGSRPLFRRAGMGLLIQEG